MQPPKVLHFYRCRNCASIMISAFHTSNYEPCNGCRSYMRWLFDEVVETPEAQQTALDVARLGKVFRWSPGAEPLKHVPEARKPMPPPATAEQIEASRLRRERIWAEDEARMEAAYKAAEEQQ